MCKKFLVRLSTGYPTNKTMKRMTSCPTYADDLMPISLKTCMSPKLLFEP